jgi:small subunit ribosomal protein S9
MSRYLAGTGRRKSAVALVRLTKGKGEVVVNDKPLAEYFPVTRWQESVLEPLEQVGKVGEYGITVKVRGGGVSAQADAIQLGIARALLSENEELKGGLKKAGLLRRDARIKERKKYGLKKARKAPQFSKR